MPLLEKVERIAYELMMDQQLPMAAVPAGKRRYGH